MSQRWHKSKQFNKSNKIKLTALSNCFELNGLGDPLRWRSPRRGGLRQRLWSLFSLAIILLTVCTACTIPPVVARDRSFPEMSLNFLGEYQLPKITFEGTPVGGLSGITYDAKGISGVTSQAYRFYAISDDKSENGEARFYSLRLDLKSSDPANIRLKKVAVEGVTSLKKTDGETFPWDSINPKGIALSPRNSVFVASEGITHAGIPPVVGEFDLKTGKLRGELPIPKRYIPDASDEKQQQGVLDNLGFESLSIDPETFSPGGLDPFRLFVATEAPLMQDLDPEQASKLRLLHYIIVDKTAGINLRKSLHIRPSSHDCFERFNRISNCRWRSVFEFRTFFWAVRIQRSDLSSSRWGGYRYFENQEFQRANGNGRTC